MGAPPLLSSSYKFGRKKREKRGQRKKRERRG
jgi:hypothetical protein